MVVNETKIDKGHFKGRKNDFTRSWIRTWDHRFNFKTKNRLCVTKKILQCMGLEPALSGV